MFEVTSLSHAQIINISYSHANMWPQERIGYWVYLRPLILTATRLVEYKLTPLTLFPQYTEILKYGRSFRGL
jgi:hypothetical protein